MTVFRAATLRTFFFAIFAGAKELIYENVVLMYPPCFYQGCESGGSGPFSVETEVEAEARKIYYFHFHIGYLT